MDSVFLGTVFLCVIYFWVGRAEGRRAERDEQAQRVKRMRAAFIVAGHTEMLMPPPEGIEIAEAMRGAPPPPPRAGDGKAGERGAA